MATVAEKIELMNQKKEHIRQGGGEARIAKQHEKGKMTARERIEMFFDEGTFVELDMFVKHRCTNFGQEKKELPGEGVVIGYGTVDGRLVYAYAQDFTVEGGSLGEKHAHKIWKVMDLAMKMGAPVIGINDSGGARIQEAVDALSGYAGIFFRNTAASGVIPQISVIMGPCAGGAVYSPAITDFIYMVKNTSQMFITGPAVIKSVTAEEVTAEELGGAMTHNTRSGVAHFAAENEEDCIKQIRYLLSFLPSNNMEDAPIVETDDDPDRQDESLNTVVPDNPNAPYDMKDVIRAIVDDGEFYEVHEHFATNIITCFARFDGRSNRLSWQAVLMLMLPISRHVSSDSVTPSISRLSTLLMFRASCLVLIRNTTALSDTVPRCCTLTVKRQCRKLPLSLVRLMAALISQCAAVNSVQIKLWLGQVLKLPSWVLPVQLISSSAKTRIKIKRLLNMLRSSQRLIRQQSAVMQIWSLNRKRLDLISSQHSMPLPASVKLVLKRNTEIFHCN